MLLPLSTSFLHSLSSLPFSCSSSLSPPTLTPTSPSPAVYLLALTVCAVNNWWSSLTQRVTGPRENVSCLYLFIYQSIFKYGQSEGPRAPVFIPAQRLIDMRRRGGDCAAAACCSCRTCDHERVNAARLADSGTEGGKGSLNEWEAGGRKEEEWQNDRVN